MSDSTDAAFPIQPFVRPSGDYDWGNTGLTKREYFARGAMEQLIAAVVSGKLATIDGGPADEKKIAAQAYVFADAMLEAGRKQP